MTTSTAETFFTSLLGKAIALAGHYGHSALYDKSGCRYSEKIHQRFYRSQFEFITKIRHPSFGLNPFIQSHPNQGEQQSRNLLST